MLKKADICYRISVALYFTLLVAMAAKVVWIDPPEGSVWKILLIAIIPLLLPVYGFLKRQPRASAWLCFIVCIYFTRGVVNVWIDMTAINEWILTLSSFFLFISAMMFTRWQGKANNQH
nr:DUF2069 domain-containing protein [Endozoicomonas sp. OPT23]